MNIKKQKQSNSYPQVIELTYVNQINELPVFICDNVSDYHEPVTVGEDLNALRVYCHKCHEMIVIRKSPITGAPEKNHYAQVFRKDILQGNNPLFYKAYPQWLKN